MTDETIAEPEKEVRMTIWEHLGELRSRLIRALIAFGICTVVCWVFRVEILDWLQRPYAAAWREAGLPGNLEFQTLSPADVFVGYLQLSLVGGVVCSAPIIFYE